MIRRLTILSLILISGCDLLPDFLTGSETGSPELKAFTSEDELAKYLTDQITARNDDFAALDRAVSFEGGGRVDDALNDSAGGAPPTATDGDGAIALDTESSADGFSQTTIQEAGVDESDVIKTDGTYIYMLDDSTASGTVLRIVQVTPRESLAVVSVTPIAGYGRDIYLYDDKVIALTFTGGGYFILEGGGGIAVDDGIELLEVEAVEVGVVEISQEAPSADDSTTPESGSSEPGSDADSIPPSDDGTDDRVGDDAIIEPDFFAPEYRYERPRTIVTVVDVSSREAPEILTSLTLDGTQSSSRLVDGVLHVVLSNYQSYYYDVLPALGQESLDVTSVDVSSLLPTFDRIEADGTTSSDNLVTWENVYHPTDPDGFGMVTVASIDIDNDAAMSAVGVVAEPGMIYSSRAALYLTDTNYNFRGDQRETTDIYKFSYIDRGSQPVATGVVPGRVLNQYSMGEHEGYLRVATTIGRTFSFDGIDVEASNNVYVLGEVDGTLSTIGSVEGIAPRETIQSARFIGDRGYVVTFEETDPLFTLDLSDPSDPRVIGELEVPGFSTLIVPMDADHLLTVGQYVPPPGEFGNWGVQVSIFDVSDFANPLRQSNYIVGDDTGAYSEALWNPKAFTYYAETGMVALPLSIYGNSIVFEDPLFDVDFDVELIEGDGGTTSDTVVPAPPDEPVDSDGSTSGSADSGTAVVDDPAVIDEPIDTIEPFVLEGFEGVLILKANVEDGVSEMGRISSRFEDSGYYWSSFTRGVFIGDDAMAVTNHGIRGGPATAVEATTFELVYPTPEVAPK